MKRFVTILPGLGPDLLASVRGRRSVPSWLSRKRTYLLPAARHALYWGWKASGFPRGSGVLVPAFVCNSVTQPLEQAGARIILFNVNADLSPDWEDAARRVRDAKALLWYHFLGLTLGFDAAIEFSRAHGLALIEDCAHALFSRYRGAHVGQTGDFASYSIRKTLPTPLGGALALNHPRYRLRRLPAAAKTAPALEAVLREREAYFYRLHLQGLDRTRRIPSAHYTHYYNILAPFLRDSAALHRLDEASLRVIRNVQPEAVRRTRQRNFLRYWEKLRELTPVRAPSPGAAPNGFPILVKNRDAFKKRLERAGVESTVHWPDWLLPRGAARRFPTAKKLADTILTLPCHQDLSKSEIDYVCATVRKLV